MPSALEQMTVCPQCRVSPKSYLRDAAIRNASITKGIISGYKKAPPVPYDYDGDPNNVANFDPIAREIVGEPSPNVAGLGYYEQLPTDAKAENVKRLILLLVRVKEEKPTRSG
jgi:hypothetical protein